jgi:hypothetical protein
MVHSTEWFTSTEIFITVTESSKTLAAKKRAAKTASKRLPGQNWKPAPTPRKQSSPNSIAKATDWQNQSEGDI